MSTLVERIPLAVGSTVHHFEYKMKYRHDSGEELAHDSWSKAHIYLSESPPGVPKQRLIQFWHENEVAERYHGAWQSGGPELILQFNGRGPVDDAGRERPLNTSHLWRIGWAPITYTGKDYQHRDVRMVFQSLWIFRESFSERLPDPVQPHMFGDVSTGTVPPLVFGSVASSQSGSEVVLLPQGKRVRAEE